MKKWSRIILCFAAALVCVCGAKKNADAAEGNWSGAKQAVIDAYKNYQTEVDVTSYNLNYSTEYSELKSMMNEVLNETTYLFYTSTSYTVSRNSRTNQIVKIGLGYSAAYKKADGSVKKAKIKNTRTKIDAAVEAAMAEIQPTMTKVEKALVLHDYLIANTSYVKSNGQNARITEEGVFLKHKANCQGYALAYAALMQKAGIPVIFVSSKDMSHIWNAIKIGGKWYNVDVTWDDPVDSYESLDQYGLVNHKNFLSSASQMKKNGHYDFDESVATSTKYDKKFWKGITSQIFYNNGKWMYMAAKGIKERDTIIGSKAVIRYNITGKCLVRFDSSRFYLIAYDNIYLYDYTSNAADIAWKKSSVYVDAYALTQIKCEKGLIYYRLLNGQKHVNGSLQPGEDGKI